MRIILLALVLLGLTASISPAAPVLERVDFTTATTPLTPFALRRAKAQGIELKEEVGTPLRGLLARPSGEGPFPAVILLHGCDGLQPFQEQWATEVASWGYVALLVDSNGPRGLAEDCATWPPIAGSRAFDAFGALRYVRGLPAVIPDRIGLIGWGSGGYAILRVLEVKGAQQLVDERFAASVAIYPTARPLGPVGAPLLLLVGDEDDCFPATPIERAMQEVEPGRFPFWLELVRGAGHGFDNPRFAEPVHLTPQQAPFCWSSIEGRGATLTYNEAARDAAVKRVQAFLKEHLKSPPAAAGVAPP